MKNIEYANRDKERGEFKQLILENPNYFGTIVDPVLAEKFQPVFQMKGNTRYEELTCVGLYPEDDLLEAVIEVKLPYGYKGDLCTEGSKEYVAFYVDYGDGSGFVSVGAPAEVAVHDIAAVADDPLYYAVRKPFTPEEYLKCKTPQVVQVRAILSWEDLPTGPDYVPVWGNILETWVQIKPAQSGWLLLQSELLPAIAAPLADSSFLASPTFPLPPPELVPEDTVVMAGSKKQIRKLLERSRAAEKRIREVGKVAEERVAYKELMTDNPNYFGSITEAKEPGSILDAIEVLPPDTVKALKAQLAINPELLVPVYPLLQKTRFEELQCVGLYPEEDLLEAVLEIKKPTGFNGSLCTLGSKEYVAFYIDWGDGVFDHVGTATVGVHDIPKVAKEHLSYAVQASIPDIEAKLKKCNTENIVTVKAILSWNVDPTPFGPFFTPTWGNVLTRRVQIRPSSGASVKCGIEIVNEIHVDDIGKTGDGKGLAIKIDGTGHLVPGTFDRPLGGVVACWGNINISDAAYYRFRFKQDAPGATWEDVRDPRRYRTLFHTAADRMPDSDGWFSKSQYFLDKSNYSLSALVHWKTGGKNGDYVLRLELADATKTPLPGQTHDVPILLDNTGIDLLEFGGTPAPLPAEGVVVKDGAGNFRKCATFVGSEAIKVFGNFRDDFFRGYRLTVFGGNIKASGEVIDSGRYDDPSRFDSLGFLILDDEGIAGAFDGGPGRELYSLDLCTIPQTPQQVK